MQNWPTLLIGVVIGVTLGALLTWLLLRVRYAVPLATAATERDLLRARVDHLTMLADQEAGRHADTVELVAPLRETLVRVETQVHALERDRGEQFARVALELARVEGETQHLGRQTASLAGSLRSSTVRGAWGEVQLRRVLEASGMLARCDFDEQVTAVSAHDRGVRPDVVVRLPGDKVLVVDAKAPMAAFLDAQGEDLTDDERGDLLREHAASLGRHVSALATKEYWSAFREGPEMVVCFVPSDAMLGAALAAQPSLHDQALSQRVVLVGPGSLMALLRTVAFTWQQDALSSSARELLDLGRDLHRRLATLALRSRRISAGSENMSDSSRRDDRLTRRRSRERRGTRAPRARGSRAPRHPRSHPPSRPRRARTRRSRRRSRPGAPRVFRARGRPRPDAPSWRSCASRRRS
jgi:DNA recombination protein RmuC